MLADDGHIEYINSYARKLFTTDRRPPRSFWALLPPERQAGFRQQFQRARQTNGIVKFDEYVPELGYWYLISVHPLPDNRLLVFMRDTSTDVEEDYRTRTLLQHSTDGLLLLNDDLTEQYHHNVLWEAPVQDTPDSTHLECIYPADRDRFAAAAEELKPGGSTQLRYRLQLPDGGWRWLQAIITNRLADPGTRALVVNYRDITVERRARTEISRRQEELRKTGESLSLRLQRLQRLHRIARIATFDNISLDSMLERIISEVSPDAGASARVFIKVNDRMVHSADSSPQLFPDWSAADQESNRIAVRAFDQRATLAIDITADPGTPELRKLGFKQLFATPFSKSGTQGVTLALLRFSTADVEDMQNYSETVAGFVTSTVASRHLIDRLERSAMDSHTLARFSHQAERLTTTRELLQQALSTLSDELQLRLIQFCEVRDGQVIPRAVLGAESAQEQAAALEAMQAGSGMLDRTVNHALPALINGFASRSDEPANLAQFGLVSAMAVPMQQHGEVRHVVLLGHADADRQFSESELAFSVLLCERLATSMQRVEYLDEIKGTRDATFRALGRALEYRDYETLGHTDRVTRLSRRFAKALSLNERQLQAITWGAYLHDLGKLSIPDGILQKPGKLTAEEFETVKRHTEYGTEMCRDIPFLPEATHQIVRSHHERWDGTGYPDRLAGADIPFPARLFALVDVFDALTTERVYKEAWPVDRALAEIEKLAGTHFDPELAPEFLKLIRSGPC